MKRKPEAKRRKKEIEYKKEMGSFVVRKCKTLDELITEYVALYGKENEDDEVISLSPSYLLESPSFDDGMMEIQLQKRLQIFLLNKICQSKTHGQTVLVCVILFIDKKISCAFDRKFN